MMRRDVPRQRLPAAIQRLPQLEQDVYKAIAWKGCAPEAAKLAEFLEEPRRRSGAGRRGAGAFARDGGRDAAQI